MCLAQVGSHAPLPVHHTVCFVYCAACLIIVNKWWCLSCNFIAFLEARMQAPKCGVRLCKIEQCFKYQNSGVLKLRGHILSLHHLLSCPDIAWTTVKHIQLQLLVHTCNNKTTMELCQMGPERPNSPLAKESPSLFLDLMCVCSHCNSHSVTSGIHAATLAPIMSARVTAKLSSHS